MVEVRSAARAPHSEQRPPRDGADRVHAAPAPRMPQRPDGQLLQADDVRAVARSTSSTICAQEGPPPGRRRCCRGRGSRCGHEHGHARSLRGRARPARRSSGLHAAVRPRARGRARARGRRRRARHVAFPLRRARRSRTATGAGSSSIRSRRASSAARALRLPLKVAEHPLGLAALRAPRGRRRSTCSGSRAGARRAALPPAPAVGLHGARPAAAPHGAQAPTCGGGSSRASTAIVVHSERGRETLAALGVERERCGSSRTPCSRATRSGATTAARCSPSAMIRPYKGLGDAIDGRAAGRRRAAARRGRPARADRAVPRGRARASRSSGGSAISPQPEVDRALGDATVAVFPYRPELDQSGALLRALGAGVPAVAYDVGGVAEPVRALRRRPRRARRRRRRRSRPPSASCSPTARRSSGRAQARGARARS